MEDNVTSPISVDAEIKSYTLVGDDIYVKRYTNENIPTWYKQLISDIIAQDNTITDMDAAIDYLGTLPAGYNQMITELQDADTTINTSLESLVATTGSHTAAIGNLQVTKTDAESAAAIARTTVGAYFADGSAGAFFNTQISSYASEIAANAANISTLSAALDGHTVSIDTVEDIAINASSWSANASKLITNPDGQITGWSFGDGSNTKSYFDIYADNFRIVNSTYNFVPFSISGSQITFNGVVDFTSTNAYGTTTIDGGKITTNSLKADRLLAGDSSSTVWTGGGLVSSNFDGNVYGNIGTPTNGFRLSSDSAGTSSDPSIYGAYIKGGVVEASILISDSVYVANSLYLSNTGLTQFTRYSYGAIPASSSGYIYSDKIYGYSYGAGFIQNRATKDTITVELLTRLSSNIGVSLDGGATWTTIFINSSSNAINGHTLIYSVQNSSVSNSAFMQFRSHVQNELTYSVTADITIKVFNI